MAIASFASAYEEPTLAEGFTEIKRVNFVFEGTEEERKLWSMWLSTETK
jgi:bifunctional polynucleotide phosphatase/kinase